jgi:drug/metabolite transporter (DMT)-like permease
MFPIWVALLSWPLLGLRPERSLWLAVGCGVLGVVCMQQPQIAQGNYVWLIAFGSSFWSAIALLGLHRLGGLDTRAVVAHFSAVSMIASSLAWALWPTLTQPAAAAAAAAKPTAGPLEWSWSLVGLLLLVGVTATIGQLFLTKAFATGHPGRVSVVGLSQVGFGMLLELLFRGRNFNSLTVVGIVLVLAPTAWVMLRERRPAVPIDP